MFKRGYILGRKGRFWDQKTLHIITKKGGSLINTLILLAYTYVFFSANNCFY